MARSGKEISSKVANAMGFTGGALAKNSVLAMIFNGIRLVAQAATLILLGRIVGPEGLGTFIGTAGFAVSIGALSGLGSGLVMYEEVTSRKSPLGAYWQHTVATVVWSGLFLSVVGIIASRYLFDVDLSIRATATIFLADVLFLPIVVNAACALAATERIGLAACLSSTLAIVRLLALAVFCQIVVAKNVESYVTFYLAATILVAITGLVVVNRVSRPERLGKGAASGTWRRGMGFMAVWATGTGLASLDKAIVLRYAGAEAAGIYGPAYRAATVLAFPVESMSMAAMPRLFQKFAGTKSHRGLVASLLIVTTVYSVGVVLLLWAAAPVLLLLLGDRFAETVDVVRWLSLFVPCYALRTLGGTILMAAGLKFRRALAEVVGVASMMAFGALLLSRGDLMAAAVMITAVEGAVAAFHWVTIIRSKAVPEQKEVRAHLLVDE